MNRAITSPRSSSQRKSANRKAPKAHGSPSESFFCGQKFIGEPLITVLDIETSPSLGYVWGKYEQDVMEFEQDWRILSFAFKRLHSKQTYVLSSRNLSEKQLLQRLWKLIDSTDIIVGQNIDRFDLRKINARFLVHGITPPAPYMTIDTLKLARRFFMFDSNKLDDLGQQLGVGRKLATHGKHTWLGAMKGDLKAWKVMEKYNRFDVILNERVFLKMLPWLLSKPNRRRPITAKAYAL